MTLEQGYFITQIAGGIVLILSIIFLALQVRQNSRMLERVMNEDYRGHSHILFDQIAFNPEFADFYKKAITDYESLDDLQKFRAMFVARRGVRSIMQSVAAYLQGFVTADQFKITQESITQASKATNVKKEWERTKHLYSPEAQKIWDSAASK